MEIKSKNTQYQDLNLFNTIGIWELPFFIKNLVFASDD